MWHKLFLTLLMIAVLLSGCWDQEDITKRTFVLGIGLDRAPQNRIKVSLQIPIVEGMPNLFSGIMVAKPFFILTAEGKNTFAAIPELQSKTMREMFLGQVKTIIINTDLARQGLKGPADFLRRHPTLPPQAFLLLTSREARQILSVTISNMRIPVFSTVGFFHSRSKLDWVFSQRVWEFSRNIHSKTQDAFIPIIDYNHREKAFVIKGLGVFHDDRMTGRLTPEQTRMFGLLSGQAQNAYLSLPVQKYGRITYRKVAAKPKVKVKRHGKQPEFEVKVRARGYLAESTNGRVGLTSEDLKRIETATAHYLNREMVKTVRHLQQVNSDTLALGEKLRAAAPQLWETVDWDRVYPTAKIKVSIRFSITRTGTML